MDNCSTQDPSTRSSVWKKNKRKKERRKMLKNQNGLPSTDQTNINKDQNSLPSTDQTNITSTLNISRMDNSSTKDPSSRSPAWKKNKRKKERRKMLKYQNGLPSTDQTYIKSTLNISTVDDASIGNSSDKFSDGRYVVVRRARKSKMKPISQEGQQTGLTSISDPSSNQMVEKDAKCEDGERPPEMSVNVAKNGFLATVKEHSLLDVSCSSQEMAPVGHSRRKLLILDLNGLLVDIVSPPPKDCISEINISRQAVFKRPFCYDFLKFCFERFDVAIWSSRTTKTIGRVVDYLFEDMKDKILFCWDLSHCTKTGFKTLENKHKMLVFKELRKIWRPQDPILPWKKGDYSESNTLLLDDSPYKALLNPTYTAIFPHSYSYKDRDNNSLGPGGDLRVYLENLAVAENVKKYVEHHPFGQSAINRTSPSWDFYLNVLISSSFTPKEKSRAFPTTPVRPA